MTYKLTRIDGVISNGDINTTATVQVSLTAYDDENINIGTVVVKCLNTTVVELVTQFINDVVLPTLPNDCSFTYIRRAIRDQTIINLVTEHLTDSGVISGSLIS